MKKYIPAEFEDTWAKIWEKEGIYKMPQIKKGDPKFYSLYSFPYPSGAGLHVGHVEGMVANDIAARFSRMQGKATVLPMGWDSFGLPAENYAIKTGIHPKDSTDEIVKTFKDQINKIGISVDWSTEVGAHWPEYYRWTQWIFLQLYKHGLAYQKEAPVNWCPSCQTVLANEQVVDGKCERCGTEVVQKNMKQWLFKITDFAERLDKDLDKVDWPKSTKEQQRNWIGKSQGITYTQKVKNLNIELTAYDSVPQTFMAQTFSVIAPDHPVVKKLVEGTEYEEKVTKFVEDFKKRKVQNKFQINKEIEGIFTGRYIENPFGTGDLPIWIATFVIADYGSGFVNSSAHDERDFQFAKKYNIQLRPVMFPAEPKLAEKVRNLEICYHHESEGILNSPEEFKGRKWGEVRGEIIGYIEKNNLGKATTQYKLRDWLVSRQRYWGAPIPIVYDPEGNPHPVDESDLPVLLPYDVNFKPTGESPLKYSKAFHKSAEEKYGKGWRREADTMDTFVDSSWYFLRHLSAHDDKQVFDPEKADAWLPTDLYMIGAEHIVLHLLYSRFFTKFFFDQKMISFDEPFQRMRHMGTILGPDGRKMSKRWGNVINPNDVIREFGADTVRIYEMFMGPLDQSKPWDAKNVHGAYRFLIRIWKLYTGEGLALDDVTPDKEVVVQLKKTIQKVTEDIPELKFNTAIAAMMTFLNVWEGKKLGRAHAKEFLQILAPFAPFAAEELWRTVFEEKKSIHVSSWPKVSAEEVKDEMITIPVQVNGKIRATIQVAVENADQNTIVKLAVKEEKVKSYVEGKDYKVIYVPKRILNLIVMD
jgi:leucyl-tRNA synthetase